MSLCTAALMAAVFIIPASALEYFIESPSLGNFGTPTSDETVCVGTEDAASTDRSKNAALIPPGFGTPTSYLPGSGEPLAPNRVVTSSVSLASPQAGTLSHSAVPPFQTAIASLDCGLSKTTPSVAYTDVTSDLYYSSGYLGTLKIPALDVSVKVYQGTDSTQLAKGAGHFAATSIWDGNVCIAGHNRGTNCYFGQIHTLDVGDTIKLTTKLGTRTYAVASVTKISETDSSMLAATAENCITLYTCVRNQPAYRWCVRAVEI